MDDKKKTEDKDIEKTSGNKKESSSDEIIPEEILEAIPEEDRGKFASIIRQTMISGVMKRSNPIADKITPEHITQIISKSDDQDKRDREERKGERYYNLLLIVIALVFIGFLIVFLQTNEDLLIKIVIGIISFVGGFGFGQSRKKKED
ncbi:MAG: hypothetical protein EOM23_08535 [Candidatus Moranbacteria bacterium]|nr:hypothetical protein [Candidatus Moranbacteria bacterium]